MEKIRRISPATTFRSFNGRESERPLSSICSFKLASHRRPDAQQAVLLSFSDGHGATCSFFNNPFKFFPPSQIWVGRIIHNQASRIFFRASFFFFIFFLFFFIEKRFQKISCSFSNGEHSTCYGSWRQNRYPPFSCRSESSLTFFSRWGNQQKYDSCFTIIVVVWFPWKETRKHGWVGLQ